MNKILFPLLFLSISWLSFAQRQSERLDRGVFALYTSGNVLVNWRIFGTDPSDIAFNLYQKVNGGSATKVNSSPISAKSNYLISGVSLSSSIEYYVKPIVNSTEEDASKSFVLENTDPFFKIALDIPADTTMVVDEIGTVETLSYHANDCSVGDLNGDGDYEIIVKWMPSNQTDNVAGVFTGNVIFDAYTLEGLKLWRINMGKNIRAGAHYNPFLVFDFDGDGRAELACKTAPGTIDGLNKYLHTGPASSDNDQTDYRNAYGVIMSGPEYLTVFDGFTGEEKTTVYYTPRRHPSTENPTTTQLNDIWGDNYGNRSERYLACVAYLDGVRPSLIMCRGYYTRTALTAYDFRNGSLSQRWAFDTYSQSDNTYKGQGNHNLAVADVDADGKDEIIYGSMAVDDNGSRLYSTGLGHGDALHVSDLDPTHSGLEVFSCHETGGNGLSFRDAATGQILWQKLHAGDIGRGVSFDIDPNYPGNECWGAEGGGVYNAVTGDTITKTYPQSTAGSTSYNAAIWWDGDLLRELYDRKVITKWNWTTLSTNRLLTAYNYTVNGSGANDNNSTKSNPCLIADIWGDWREELILRNSTSTHLMIFSTPSPTDYGFYTLMHDSQYRLGVAWQNVGYNQPAHTSFFLGSGMNTPPVPSMYYVADQSARWNGNGNWSDQTKWINNTKPGVTSKVIVQNGVVHVDENVTVDTLILLAGTGLTVDAGKTLNSKIELRSNVNGSATILNNGFTSFSASSIKQFVGAGRNWYFSSPVNATTFESIYSGEHLSSSPPIGLNENFLQNQLFWSFNESTSSWNSILNSNDQLIPGRGYVVSPVSDTVLIFNGTFNDGEISSSLSRTGSGIYAGFNLIGNPYPSYLNWSEVIKTNVSSTLWFRTKESSNYKFYTFNASASLGVPSSVSPNIPPMQAFWVKVEDLNSPASVTFNNSMRSHRDQSTNIFRVPSGIKNKLLRLVLTDGNVEDETLIYFYPNAKNEVELYDSPKISDPNSLEVYSIVDNTKLVINGMEDFQYSCDINLGINIQKDGKYVLKLTELTGFPENMNIMLLDQSNQTISPISLTESYQFSNETVNESQRFVLVLSMPQEITQTESVLMNDCNIRQIGNEIVIDPKSNAINYELYNSSGKLLEARIISMSTTLIGLPVGVYFLRINNHVLKIYSPGLKPSN